MVRSVNATGVRENLSINETTGPGVLGRRFQRFMARSAIRVVEPVPRSRPSREPSGSWNYRTVASRTQQALVAGRLRVVAMRHFRDCLVTRFLPRDRRLIHILAVSRPTVRDSRSWRLRLIHCGHCVPQIAASMLPERVETRQPMRSAPVWGECRRHVMSSIHEKIGVLRNSIEVGVSR